MHQQRSILIQYHNSNHMDSIDGLHHDEFHQYDEIYFMKNH
jgi:hypothetical protein